MKTEVVLSLYEQDKALGRRLSNGAKPIKKLNVNHRRLIALVLEGFSGNDIALTLGMTPSRVSIIKSDPLVQSILSIHLAEADQQLGSLLPKAVESLRKGLESADLSHSLRATDILFKTQGKFKDSGDDPKSKLTAEDVARQIIKVKNGEVEIITEHGSRISTE